MPPRELIDATCSTQWHINDAVEYMRTREFVFKHVVRHARR